jgi:nitric oxide reductase subunit B
MRKLWLYSAIMVLGSFGVPGWIGSRIYQEMPPIPERMVATDGREVIGSGEIGRGQNVWQSLGGMEVGSIWGRGSYVAPDWTAEAAPGGDRRAGGVVASGIPEAL